MESSRTPNAVVTGSGESVRSTTRDSVSCSTCVTYLTAKAEAEQQVKDLEAEREAFYMDYRMKCDVQTKEQAVRLEAAEQHRDALRTALKLVTERHEGYGLGMGQCMCEGHITARAAIALADGLPPPPQEKVMNDTMAVHVFRWLFVTCDCELCPLDCPECRYCNAHGWQVERSKRGWK